MLQYPVINFHIIHGTINIQRTYVNHIRKGDITHRRKDQHWNGHLLYLFWDLNIPTSHLYINRIPRQGTLY